MHVTLTDCGLQPTISYGKNTPGNDLNVSQVQLKDVTYKVSGNNKDGYHIAANNLTIDWYVTYLIFITTAAVLIEIPLYCCAKLANWH